MDIQEDWVKIKYPDFLENDLEYISDEYNNFFENEKNKRKNKVLLELKKDLKDINLEIDSAKVDLEAITIDERRKSESIKKKKKEIKKLKDGSSKK